jgi:hypothetical protein
MPQHPRDVLDVRLGSNVDVVVIDDARLENLIQTAKKLARRGLPSDTCYKYRDLAILGQKQVDLVQT